MITKIGPHPEFDERVKSVLATTASFEGEDSAPDPEREKRRAELHDALLILDEEALS
jgi:hypothetical protein